VILLFVRWYQWYPLAYHHVSELLEERGVAVDPTCIWRWVQVYGERVRLLDHSVADVAGDRSDEHDSEGRARCVAREDSITHANFVAELFGLAA
jgi:hypothetical protein